MSHSFLRPLAVISASALLTVPCVAAVHAHHASGRTHGSASHIAAKRSTRGHHAAYAAAVHHEPAPAMDPARATEIQTALIHAGYLSGEPSGVWDATSVAAMQKLQDANGWQTKFTPDSRALAKLGLGAGAVPAAQAAEAPDVAQTMPVAQP